MRPTLIDLTRSARRACAVVVFLAAAAPRLASAEPGRPHAYGVVVGSNAGGAGQEPLRYAEADARRVAEVLTELGHYDTSDVAVIVHPDAAHVLAAVDAATAKASAALARGEQAEVVFYYSGHARANALELGGDELPLTTLRERLRTLPDALTLVILDACQSGSFSRVKGAEPAADFTYNSVSRLTQKGLAVMASSTSEELSQESDELGGSYFTSHLVAALRGAGDQDGDGRVSLDEAYRYAYRRTLASTARTQVGEQHVTLETDLAGQGEVPLTYPAEARAQLELPGPLVGRVLVQLRPGGAVLAEVQKAPGSALRLGLIAGSYDVVVRDETRIVQCDVVLRDDHVTVLDATRCAAVVAKGTTAKGSRRKREVDLWTLELGAGFIGRESDGYTDRLRVFGYTPKVNLLALPTGRFTLGASRQLVPHVSGLLQVGTLAGDTYVRSIEGSTDTVAFGGYGASLSIRASADVVRRVLGVYGQAGGGLSLGQVTETTSQTGVPPSSTTVYAGYLLSVAAGVTARLPEVATFYLEAGYDRAPAIRNLVGDTHDSGGVSGVLGVRFRFGDDR